MLKTQLHPKRSSSIASSWHPSAFSFCSSPSKPQDNSFFRSTWPVKVWKCFDGHVFQPLFASSAEVRKDLPSKGRLYENLLFCLPPDFLSTLFRCCIPWQRALILFPFSSCRAVFQATATTYPASSSNWVKKEWRKCVVQICNSVWSETNGTLCTLGAQVSAVSADAPLLLQAARGTTLSFSSDTTS